MTPQEQQTLAFYDRSAEKFIISSAQDTFSSFWAAELEIYRTLLPVGSVLDIGVGKGKEARVLIEMGYNYTGVEPANGLHTYLQKEFPAQTFIKNNVYNWNIPSATFDGFWCSAMLLHIPPNNIDFVLQQIKKVMKEGAIGFISLAAGQGEYFDQETGRYFYLYNQDDFSSTLERNGFIIQKKDIRPQDTPRVWLRKWLTYFVQIKMTPQQENR